METNPSTIRKSNVNRFKQLTLASTGWTCTIPISQDKTSLSSRIKFKKNKSHCLLLMVLKPMKSPQDPELWHSFPIPFLNCSGIQIASKAEINGQEHLCLIRFKILVFTAQSRKELDLQRDGSCEQSTNTGKDSGKQRIIIATVHNKKNGWQLTNRTRDKRRINV